MDRDTICAPASAPVQSALAVIRISGPACRERISSLFSNYKNIAHQKGIYGHIVDGDQTVDDVVCTFYKGPRSFTGEDTIELSCHGNPLIVQNILSLIMRDGTVRMALPGEFTRRAFENGKMDLSEAQAVNAVIHARSEWEIETALKQMHGSLKNEINSIRDNLILLKADVEAAIDFSTEEIEFVSREEIMKSAGQIREQLSLLYNRCRLGEKISQGLNIAIVGKPNAGKSSILNYIVNEERAIVTDIPGTTRDLLRETVQINGIHINLIDTAGIRHSDDAVEKIGIQRSREAVAQAHIVLAVLDSTTGITGEDREIMDILPKARVLYIINKWDIHSADNIIDTNSLQRDHVCFSAKTGQGFGELEKKVSRLMESGIEGSEHSYLADGRILSILERSLELGSQVCSSIEMSNPEEIIASDILQLLECIQEVTGEVTPNDVLESIFSRFCIGK